MSSPTNSAGSEATTAIPTCQTPKAASNNSRPDAEEAQLAACRQQLHALESQYWNLRWRFEALPHEFSHPDAEPYKTLHREAATCRKHLETRTSKLCKELAFLTDCCNGIEFGHGNNAWTQNSRRKKYYEEFQRKLGPAERELREVESALEKLEAFRLSKTFELEQGRVRDRIQRLKEYYEHVESSWMKIDLSVRETAKLDLETMRLCIAAFEAPSCITPPFQQGMKMLEEEAPAFLDASVEEMTIEYVEGWSNRLGWQAACLEAYLNRLRFAVVAYQGVEREVLEERRRARAAAKAVKAAQDAQASKKAFGPKALVGMARSKREGGKNGTARK